MAKRESPRENETRFRQPGIGKTISVSQEKLFGAIKFILGVCLLPFVISSSAAFLEQLSNIEKGFQGYFWLGVAVFLIFYLFIWEPEVIYSVGRRLLELVFNFFEPFLRIAPDLLPAHTIILFIVYKLLTISMKQVWITQYFIFLFGFTTILHIVFTAKSISAKKDFLKGNYIFSFSLIYIVNLLLLGLFFGFIFKEFSFISFAGKTFSTARDALYNLFSQIFLNK